MPFPLTVCKNGLEPTETEDALDIGVKPWDFVATIPRGIIDHRHRSLLTFTIPSHQDSQSPSVMEYVAERLPNANTIHLLSSTASKITNVSLYSGQADVTRLFEFEIKAGENIVSIIGLPRSLQEDNVRVDGLGNASIHDVVIGKTESAANPPSRSRCSAADASLVRSRKEIKNSLESARRSRTSLDAYLTAISTQDIHISRLEETLDGYMTQCAKLDKQILDLEESLEKVTSEIQSARVQTSDYETTPSWRITVSLHGEIEERVKLSITYAVCSADWTPCYDVRVDTQEKEHAVTITYKAIITQATGESWENVPLTLGTVTPSFGVQPPILNPWFIDSFKPPSFVTISSASPLNMHQAQPTIAAAAPSRRARSYPDSSRSQSPRHELYSPSESSENLPGYKPTAVMQQAIVVPVSNKGDTVATFNIPGLITVPDNQGKYNVTIAELTMETTLMWYAIPVVDRMVHLKARIRNASEYIFVSGSANIYVDGSFVATTRLPAVSPQETFDCPLGLDQSIRVTYHPMERKTAKSGFVTRMASRSFTQRITVLNTKSTTLKNMKIIDRIPVPADERIEVKLLSPALNIPSSGQPGVSNSTQRGGVSVFRPVLVSENVWAQWDGADGDPASYVSQDGVGKNGKINWVLSIPPQTSISLVLQFDIIYPENLLVQGV